MNWLFISVFACLAEYETNRRRERQAIGIAKAKQDPSKYRGRRSLITPQMKQEITEDLLMNRSIVRIAERLGVSRSTVYHALRQIAQEEQEAKTKF
jgi:DNA invertase Pin-like site-specific DNA recombinase